MDRDDIECLAIPGPPIVLTCTKQQFEEWSAKHAISDDKREELKQHAAMFTKQIRYSAWDKDRR